MRDDSNRASLLQALVEYQGFWAALAALCFSCLALAGQEPDAPSVIEEPPIRDQDWEHWSFRPLVRPQLAPVEHAGWPENPIDHFTLAKMEAAGLAPLPAADKTTLIRRVTFDLTGLPPRPEEIDAFLRDDSAGAHERLIDRLLASPAYGERWAQHWLDLARFAETDGFEHDLVRPNAWRYRDWVIDALNRDMPYDEFVRWQIAGDELEPGEPAAAIATGFTLCGPDMPDINLQEERRHVVLNEMTSTVGAVFLGLQVGCAQCHDHKVDPISQADFYRLRGCFEPAEFFDEYPVATPEQRAERERQEAPLLAERKKLEAEIKGFEDAAHQRLDKDPQVKIKPEELLAALSETERQRYQELLAELAKLKKGQLPPLPHGRVLREREGNVPASRLMIRGDFRRPGPELAPGFPRIANPWGDPLGAPASTAKTSGRRTGLAGWLTRPDHPLTTRVIANRLWQLHFGQGIVRTSSDFGTAGDRPSHPELLDWLATELPRQGWSLKRMHKLLLSSATYRQACLPTGREWTAEQRAGAAQNWRRALAVDPENRLLARMNRLRLDGEAIRDALLVAGDRLSARRGGPGVMPPLPQEMLATLLKGQWKDSPDAVDHRRRSVYIFVRRNLRYPLLDVFDRPDTNASCPQRNRSTTAPQALTLLNSELALDAARDFAGSVLTQVGPDRAAQIELCYRRALGRHPTELERATAADFLERQAKRLREEGRGASALALPSTPPPSGTDVHSVAALTDFCLALFNLNEFIYLD